MDCTPLKEKLLRHLRRLIDTLEAY
jgi:hypothetical protein